METRRISNCLCDYAGIITKQTHFWGIDYLPCQTGSRWDPTCLLAACR